MIKHMFSRKGFTLIEIMIVVIIIGILAGISMPLYSRTVERSRISEAINILGSIRDAEMRYALEFGNYSDGISLAVLDITISPTGKYFDFETTGNQNADPYQNDNEKIAIATRNTLDFGLYKIYYIEINESGALYANHSEVNKLFN